jgi:hypothetical protein
MKSESKLAARQPVTANSNVTVTQVVDTKGFARAVFNVWPSAPATTNIPAVLKISEGDTTSAYTDIDQFTAGTGFTAAAMTTSTATTNAYRMDVDCRGKKRYLKLTFTMPTAQATTVVTVSSNCELYRAAQGIETATKQGVNQVVQG